MKKIISSVLFLFFVSFVYAQIPQGINYQGVAYNSSGGVLFNQAIGIEFTILDGSPTGTAVYAETHATTTDATGHFALVIGQGTPSLGTFNSINWAVGGGKFLKVGMDPTGGTSFATIGTSEFLSVPYALHAGSVLNNGGKHVLSLVDDVTDAQAATIIQNEAGPNTQMLIISSTFNLTTVDLSSLTHLISVLVEDNSALTSLNLSGLVRCDGDFIVENCPSLNSLDLSSFQKQTSGANGFLIKETGLISLNIGQLQKANGGFKILNNNNLTTINASSLIATNDFAVSFNPVLTNLNVPLLASVQGLNLQNNTALITANFLGLVNLNAFNNISGNSALTALNFPVLTTSFGLNVDNCPVLTTISLPALTTSSFNFWCINNPMLTNLSFPSLQTAYYFELDGLLALTSFSAPSLSNLSVQFIALNVPNLTTVSMPNLTTFFSPSPAVFIIGSPVLTGFSLPSLVTYGANQTFNVGGNLTVADVNSLLVTFASISPSITNCNISIGGAAPTGPGLAAKATLIANGNTVNTN